MSNSKQHRVFLAGIGAATSVLLVAGLLAGVGAVRSDGSQFVTSSADGRNAYLWESSGGSLRFVGAAHAEKGKGDDHAAGDDDADEGGKGKGQHAKPDDNEHGKGGGGGKGKK